VRTAREKGVKKGRKKSIHRLRWPYKKHENSTKKRPFMGKKKKKKKKNTNRYQEWEG